MTDAKKTEATTSVPIFVDGLGVNHAAELYLTIAGWALREEEGVRLLGSLPGEISSWISTMFEKTLQFERHNIAERDKEAVQREAMREVFQMMIDPLKKEETNLADLLRNLPAHAMHRVVEALQNGNSAALNEVRSQIATAMEDAFAKRATPESIAALGSLATRCRAARAGALCMVLHKEHPRSLIADAQGGDRLAVLKLIKVDKLFLTDTCTSEVLRQAELQIDRKFLNQVAKAVIYRPKMGWRQGCRLYIYLLLCFERQFPTLPNLHLRLDPDGSRFRSSQAFDKFVERCRKELKVLQRMAWPGTEQPPL